MRVVIESVSLVIKSELANDLSVLILSALSEHVVDWDGKKALKLNL